MAEETGLRQVVETYGDMVYRLALAQTRSSHDADDVFRRFFSATSGPPRTSGRRNTGRPGCCG